MVEMTTNAKDGCDGDTDVVPSSFICAAMWMTGDPTDVLLYGGNGDKRQRCT